MIQHFWHRFFTFSNKTCIRHLNVKVVFFLFSLKTLPAFNNLVANDC